MPWGVAAAVAGSVISGVVSAAGSSAQANATTNAQNQADQTQLQEQQNAEKIQKPYVDAGNTAETQQTNLLGLNGQPAATKAMSTFQQSPGYQYQLQQGLSAIDNGAAANGSLRSGNTLRAEEGLGSNLANQDFSNYYNRLQGLTSIGASAATNTANQAVTTGAGIASTDTSAGNQLANIYGNAANGIGSSVNNGINQLTTLGAFGNGSQVIGGQQINPSGGDALAQAPNLSVPAYQGPNI